MNCPRCRGLRKIVTEAQCGDCGGWGGFHGNIAASGDGSSHEVIDVPDCKTCGNSGTVRMETDCPDCAGHAGRLQRSSKA